MIRDLRRYAQQTNLRLILGGLLLLFLVGDGLIYFIYGRRAAVMGFICLVAGLAPLTLIWLALAVLDWIVRRANQ
ncbi:MAG TPA: hypothetical protein VLD65_08125 [Anaerolineales bacterium]|nr:hypothetical protein [Anaerolineales bacterium]